MFSLKNDKTATHVHSADMRAAALTGAICKKNTGMGKILIGRRVSVPQGYFEDIEDDGDGFCFDGIVVHQNLRRAIVRFDYTGEVQGWPVSLVRGWLQEDVASPLCDLFTRL